MDKNYYLNKYNKKMEKCHKVALEEKESGCDMDIEFLATHEFEETADVEEIVGYYLAYYEDNALSVWLKNIIGLPLTKRDNAIEQILRSLK